VLRPVEEVFQEQHYPDLLVGLGQPDDAAVWSLDEDRVLIVTTDFFTPVVDDPYDYGSIAAANSLSDIYAMGGVPFLALNVAALPPSLPAAIGGEIMRGGAEKAREAGVVLAGGHTIQDQEPKYGLICLGFAHPDQLMTKAGAEIGDRLVLSKPLGFGVTTTAIKNQIASQEERDEVVTWMQRLNAEAARLGNKHGVRAATDITGFGLLGHAWEMALHSRVGMELNWDSLAFTSGALRLAREYAFPGGSHDNKGYFGPHVSLQRDLEEYQELLLFDAQTSGGLLMAVKPEALEALLADAEQNGQPLWEIGQVTDGNQLVIV
jgi:selenide,water dikinase